MPINRFAKENALKDQAAQLERLKRRGTQMTQDISGGLETMNNGFDAATSALAAEGSTRAAADTFLGAAMTNEQAIRANADIALSNAISGEVTARNTAISNAVSGLATAASVTAEATARTNADSAEITARNTAISTAVASEATLRGNADTAEVTARNTAISSAVSAEATARDAAIAAAVGTKPGRFAATFGNAVLSSFTFTHNLNTLDVIIQVYVVATGAVVTPATISRTLNTVTLGFALAVGTSANRVVIIG